MQQLDYTGFQYGAQHSEDMGIVRVSDGSRYNDTLTPAFTDRTATVTGMDGAYYFGTNYSTKTFVLNCAFDHITEVQFRALRNWFKAKELKWLIFNELPYKKYLVKPTSAPDIKYLCFDDTTDLGTIQNPVRLYKGELTINLQAYFPFARSVHKWLGQYSNDNKAQWAASTNMLVSGTGYDDGSTTQIKVYNPGDLPADFKLSFSAANATNLRSIQFFRKNGNTTELMPDYTITFTNGITAAAGTTVVIDTQLKLIEEYNGTTKTGNLYNKCITTGTFHSIPQTSGVDDFYYITCTDSSSAIVPSTIEYDYLFF